MFRPIAAAAVILCGLTCIWTATAAAHHSVAGQFDPSQQIKLVGVISKVDWVNPHIYVHLDVKDASGTVATWRLETAPPAFMRKAGLTSAKLMGDGQEVTIEGYPARDGTQHLGWILTITYADGHYYQLSAGR
jgi:Family of unknown function (DUF6152)